jgi:N-acetylmuramoyl-L-alanine amidase
LAACGGSPSPATSLAPSSAPGASVPPSAAPSLGGGEIVPAPGSSSEVYEPNPGAIVVAIDPGHGGCLDWGVPNPWDNTVEKAEKADTLAIGLALRELLEAQGITVVMTRTDDSALAGDDYPQLGCNGPAWRDVDGDGEAGFEETGRTRTRDELQARIDLANLARADLLISIHVNSMTQDGVAFEIAATQTFYDDETPWGEAGSGALARAVQERVVAALDGAARYERQDRGTEAVAYYMISRQWRDGDTCETAGDTWCKPHRGAQLPSALAEVGSMSLEAESELLASGEGRRTVAAALYEAVRDWLGQRTLGVRYDALLPGGEAGLTPEAAAGEGPPFVAAEIREADLADGALPLRLTNTGSDDWGAGMQLLVGWSPSDAPYLADAPADLAPLAIEVPSLAPGESVRLAVPLELPEGARHLAWITLADAAGTPLTDRGYPPLQLAHTPG